MDIDEADEMVRTKYYHYVVAPSNCFVNPQVSQMEIELPSIPVSIRPQYQTRLRSAKGELSNQRKLFKECQAQLARAALLSSNAATSDEPYGYAGASESDRTRLLAGTQILEDGTKRLQDSQRMALETEAQGAGILEDLRRQRESIVNSRNVVCIH
jgi:vesicle transport through interaction with t-SNAREs 1